MFFTNICNEGTNGTMQKKDSPHFGKYLEQQFENTASQPKRHKNRKEKA